ncbi:MAG: acetyltransferase [Thermodesulfovibrionales bacterium]
MVREVVIIGSGGHAKVIIDILKGAAEYKPVGFTDPASGQKEIMGVPLLGDDSVLPSLYKKGLKYAFVAVGENRLRADLARLVIELGFELINAVSSHSYVSEWAALGRGIAIMPGAIVNPYANIGDHAIINTGATIDHDCVIESCCHVAPGCHVAGNVRIGTGTLLGIGSTVIPKTTIGAWSIIGAGTVVTGDLPEYAVARGVPARVINKLSAET